MKEKQRFIEFLVYGIAVDENNIPTYGEVSSPVPFTIDEMADILGISTKNIKIKN